MVELREPLDDLDRAPRALHLRDHRSRGRRRSGSTTPPSATASRRPASPSPPSRSTSWPRMLSDAGVHIIDMGFPSAAPSERRALELILEGKKKGRIRADLEVIVMCRSNARDIDITLDTLREDGRAAVGLHVLHLHLRLRPPPQVQDRQDAAPARGPAARGMAGPAGLVLPEGQHQDGLRRHPPRAEPRGGADRVRRRGRLARRRRRT